MIIVFAMENVNFVKKCIGMAMVMKNVNIHKEIVFLVGSK